MNNLSKNKKRIFIIITITLMSCFVCFLIYFNHYKEYKQIEYKYLGTFICGADVGDDATIVTLYASKKQTEKYDVAEKVMLTMDSYLRSGHIKKKYIVNLSRYCNRKVDGRRICFL